MSKAALDKLVEAWRAEHPQVGFTRVVVGDCGGGEGDAESQFPLEWDMELAAEMYPVWSARNYLSGSLIEVEHLIDVVDAVLRGGATLSIPSVTVAPRPVSPSLTPELSAALVSYVAEAPANWQQMLDTARLYDRVGIDRLVVSDHVVFGEHLDAYAGPRSAASAAGASPPDPTGTGSSR